MMKSDVLDTFETVKACVAYKLKDGTVINEYPFDVEGVEPVYQELKGWKTDMTQITDEAQLPQAFRDYVAFLEEQLETPITMISTGPDRKQTIIR